MKLVQVYLSVLLVLIFVPFINAQEAVSRPFFKVSGEVTKPLTLYMEDLNKMKSLFVSMKDKSGTDHKYKGVALQEILGMAGVPAGKQLHGENLSKYLLVKCADGYKVLFSLAELDS